MSATHIAFASTRVMATCAAVGQGVGTAAAYAIENNICPNTIVAHPTAITMIRRKLRCDDAFLIDAPDDPDNLVHRAHITVSSERLGSEASNVASVQTRSVHGRGGVKPNRAISGSHRWMSRELPAWIECRWLASISPALLQIVFDTGLHRVLTLSQADGYTRKMHWGRPQPETVKDFHVDACFRGVWRKIADRRDQYQRLCRIVLDGQPLDLLRITITATNGIDHARICELRVT